MLHKNDSKFSPFSLFLSHGATFVGHRIILNLFRYFHFFSVFSAGSPPLRCMLLQLTKIYCRAPTAIVFITKLKPRKCLSLIKKLLLLFVATQCEIRDVLQVFPSFPHKNFRERRERIAFPSQYWCAVFTHSSKLPSKLSFMLRTYTGWVGRFSRGKWFLCRRKSSSKLSSSWNSVR